jgi:hypothetical protein
MPPATPPGQTAFAQPQTQQARQMPGLSRHLQRAGAEEAITS